MISFKEHSFTFNNVSLTPSEQIGLHRQPLWELSYIVTGSGMRLIGDMTEPFQCGEVVMIPPEIPHCWIFNNNDTDANGQISILQSPLPMNFSITARLCFRNFVDI